jgi:hypothetical protein
MGQLYIFFTKSIQTIVFFCKTLDSHTECGYECFWILIFFRSREHKHSRSKFNLRYQAGSFGVHPPVPISVGDSDQLLPTFFGFFCIIF